MGTRFKMFLSFIAGCICTFVVFFMIAVLNFGSRNKNIEKTPNEELCMFDEPQQEIKIKKFKVVDVLKDGSAIAWADDIENYGFEVYFNPIEGISFYDGMKIVLKGKQRFMQIGLYKYDLHFGNGKTIPVVKIQDM